MALLFALPLAAARFQGVGKELNLRLSVGCRWHVLVPSEAALDAGEHYLRKVRSVSPLSDFLVGRCGHTMGGW